MCSSSIKLFGIFYYYESLISNLNILQLLLTGQCNQELISVRKTSDGEFEGTGESSLGGGG